MADHDFTDLAAKVAAVISVPAAELTPDTTISELALDSMTVVELVIDLQEDYDIILSRQDFADVRTLGDLATLIWSRLPGAIRGLPDGPLARTPRAVSYRKEPSRGRFRPVARPA